MTQVLPNEGSTTLDQVAEAVGAAPSLLGIEDTAELRSVLVPIGENKFVSFVSVLRVGWPCDLKEPIAREAGGIILAAVPFKASEMRSKQHLVEALNGWRPFGHYEMSLTFHDNVNIYRFTSYNDFSDTPVWTLQLSELSTTSLSHRIRPGPFMHPDSRFFAEDVGDALRQWTGDPNLSEQPSPGIYKLFLRDRRAWLKNLSVNDDNELSVEVERTAKSEVMLTLSTTELDGKKTVTTQELPDASFSKTVPMPLTEIRVYLTDRTGKSYDDYRENTLFRDRRRPWSLLNPRPATDPEYQELRDALDKGESETVEFKEWLPVDREKPKSKELLKTATAFANALGGVIYVGVTDDCNVAGCAKQLRKEFTNATTTDLEELRKEYAHTLGRILNEGISPAPAHVIGWINHAGIPILRVGIQSKGVIHYVVEDRGIYIRRGASDRLATPAEIEALSARKQPRKSGIFQRP